ncbi:MAG: septum site-determining protein MinC [Anaerolineae bacterium]|nr:septum site-determining protein MinC [Anaerolineae bacterium]
MSDLSDSSLVQIKGLKDGLLVTLGDAAWSVLQEALLNRVEQQASFFQGARLALDVGNQVLKAAEMSALRDTLSERGILLWAVLSNSPTTENTSQMLGLATRIHKARPTEIQAAKGIDHESALWVDRTLRSGVRVEYPGNVVIVGDVNPGAEVIAGGSVIVWGRLRGVVHAGAQGNREATVRALDLSPTQLRIADEIAVAPARRDAPKPEIVHLRDGRLQAESWKPG